MSSAVPIVPPRYWPWLRGPDVESTANATEGPGDPFDEYWSRLAEIQGVPLDRLPFIRTTDRGHRVRASYNGGLVVVRRERGILTVWANLFARSVAAGLKPWRGGNQNIYASTGFVGQEASEYWGSNQAAAALAIWSTTTRVFHYPETYNVPLHFLMEHPELAGVRGHLPSFTCTITGCSRRLTMNALSPRCGTWAPEGSGSTG